MDLIHPHRSHAVSEALRDASAAGTRVLIVGGRRHIDKGDPSEIDAELWTTLLDDRVAYEPAEMLCVVGAGMRMRDLGAMLAEGGQEWPVDAPGEATVGGLIATGGPTVRQLRVGTMRDTVVEMEVVTGDGRLVRSGARTVKNVTGYDVHRLMTGSLGTLGVIVQVALKIRPLPAATRTLVSRDGGRCGPRHPGVSHPRAQSSFSSPLLLIARRYHHDGAARLPRHPSRHRPQEQAPERSAATGADHDQRGVL